MGGCLFVKNKYIIGIDGGGTKTLGVLYDFNGLELKRVVEGFSNFSIDEQQAIKHIEHCIDKLIVQIKDEVYDLIIQMGISGASKIKQSTSLEADFALKYHASVSLETDLMIGLYSVQKKENQSVIMAIGGTGSAVMSLDNEQINSIGGYGYLLGDEGSAYHLAIAAIKNIIYEAEHLLAHSDLSKTLMTFMDISDHRALIAYVYKHNKTELADLARVIATAALAGDQTAISLLKQEGQLLGEQIVLAYQNYIKKNEVVIAVRGSFVNEAPFVKQSMIALIDSKIKKYEIEETPQEPVTGAFNLAKSIIVKG